MPTKRLFRSGSFALCMTLLIGCSALSETTRPTAVVPPSALASQPTTTEPLASATANLSPQTAPTTLPTALTPAAPSITWVHKQFADAWSLEYPAAWDVNEAGAQAGTVDMRGDYQGHRYEVAFFYPIFEHAVDRFSLEEWVDQELAGLPADQRSAITVSDLTIADAPAKKVLNFPGARPGTASHRVYIWRSGERNPRQIILQAADSQPPDTLQMAQLFDRFLAGVAAPTGN